MVVVAVPGGGGGGGRGEPGSPRALCCARRGVPLAPMFTSPLPLIQIRESSARHLQGRCCSAFDVAAIPLVAYVSGLVDVGEVGKPLDRKAPWRPQPKIAAEAH